MRGSIEQELETVRVVLSKDEFEKRATEGLVLLNLAIAEDESRGILSQQFERGL